MTKEEELKKEIEEQVSQEIPYSKKKCIDLAYEQGRQDKEQELKKEIRRDKILQRIDTLITLLEVKNKKKLDFGKEIFAKIDSLIKKTIKENKSYEKEHYWRWQFLMSGLDELRLEYTKEKS